MLYIRILIVQRKTHTERCERERRERERERDDRRNFAKIHYCYDLNMIYDL